MHIEYSIENELGPAEFRDLLYRSTLSERRPADDIGRLADMLKHANLIVCARSAGTLVGAARALTDFAYCTYLSDLAVDKSIQRQGIGRELIRRCKEAAPQATLILLSAPAAVDYYPRIGMEAHPHCYILRPESSLR